MDYEYRDILDFWFGPLNAQGLPAASYRKRWFAGGSSFDREIEARFMDLIHRASEQGLGQWREAPEGRLAEIILLDQFRRNVYRGTTSAFACDGQARMLCHEALAVDAERHLPVVFRLFLFMPLQHSEVLTDHDIAVTLYQSQLENAVPGTERFIAGFLDSAREHRDIIARFGRFPHRNEILGRASTEVERAYLEAGGRRYGQSR